MAKLKRWEHGRAKLKRDWAALPDVLKAWYVLCITTNDHFGGQARVTKNIVTGQVNNTSMALSSREISAH